METIFVTILNDFNEMNDDIRYDITINYINTDNNYSLEFTKNSYYSMQRVLFTDSDDFETAYGECGLNESFSFKNFFLYPNISHEEAL